MNSVRGRRAGLVAAVGCVIGLTGLVGCSGGEDAGPPEPSASRRPPVLPSPTPWPETRDAEEACGGNPFDPGAVVAYSPDGPAYDGPGLHPAVLLKPGVIPEVDVPQLPSEWGPSQGAGFAELIVCQYQDPGFEGEVIGDCVYLGGTLGDDNPDVRSARYDFRVFEARTGELVTEFTLDGTTTPDETCPETSYAPPSTYWQLVESDALENALRPLIEGPAPG
ncbi:hypothetical protein [Streptomyces sp. URMC 129]|uniref:hypothetical protein n=1 Tax=Streptomyces sp. URMC 129 TaxID=3423407 RepID=UPI003F1BDF57